MNGAIKSMGSQPRPNLAHARNNLHFAADGRHPVNEDRLEYHAVGPPSEIWNLRKLVQEPAKNRCRGVKPEALQQDPPFHWWFLHPDFAETKSNDSDNLNV